jgi:choline dehydrogenase-like flavoprotein
MNQADFIVVGAGSAGCVLASRLARQHGFRVTLVESPALPAARVDRERPSRWLNLLGSSDDWNFSTEPSDGLARRKLSWPRGRGLGGSSRINAMIWFPPTNHDLRTLVQASGDRWTTEELNAAYQSICTLVKPQQPRWLSDASSHFMAAAADLPDATAMVYERVNRQGRRWNPASLLDDEDTDDSSLEVVRATADRLIWDQDRAVGVRIVDGNSPINLRASRGVVLSAGTIATPMILMRSGIGPRADLLRHGIDVRVEASTVGRDLQDHLIMPVVFQTRSKNIFRANPTVRDVVRWQTLGNGPVGSNIAECGGLFSNDTIQIHVTPTNYLTFPKPTVSSVMTLGVNLTQPVSRGSIGIRSSNADEPPLIDAGYLVDDSDRIGTIQGVRFARFLATKTRLADWITTEELPGGKRESDESIAKSIARYAQTLYHPVGTCRMGCHDDAAVDPEFAVRGTQGLWVADASILPTLTVGNPSATVMSLAWLAAERVSRSTNVN